jgi:hypothetical protein
LEKLVKTIRVTDGNADELRLYEFEVRPRMFGVIPMRRVKRWALDTGEAVECLGERTFKVIKTGEILSILLDP